ncbi:hypothetical protein LSUE1_G001624 [Lachnellula suecica]|uniref:Acyltransferase 3 domain-containing protein n=1 Tax=Lachnellula suecica TaxID=602035 RepID=A0A8T9CDH0_9HELO|nr:hypothetical protein LSUE1_G001624 [Lachnellula suecica]
MENVKRILQHAEKLKVNPPTTYDQQYLLGFRGLLVIETFLHVFLQTFVPVTVAASANPDGRLYQEIIRKTLSVLLWNEYFLYGAIIFLSARSIAIPFIKSEAKDRSSRIARSVLCRGMALWFPVAVSLAICKLAFSQKYLNTIFTFKTNTGNNSMQVPYLIPNAFAYFNSVFNLFWTTHNYNVQAASTAFPSQTLWLINAVYIQSYTVYMTMIIIPYTRNRWRVQGAFLFVLTAWWVQSWAWYTISGLLFCDMVMNMDFQAAAQRGIPVHIPHSRFRRADGTQRPLRIPVWIPAGLCITAGLLMQFLWTAWRPDLFEKEYEYHTGLYYTPSLNYEYTTHHTVARDDIYLILVGFFVLLETYSVLQRMFQVRFLVYLGKRSLSYFLTQSIIVYLVGIKVFTQVRRNDHGSFPGATIATLVTCVAVTVPVAEVFYHLVELPSKLLAHRFFDFLVK